MIEVDTETESPGSEQETPPKPQWSYLDGLELFKEYIGARQTGDTATYLAIEGLIFTSPSNGGPQTHATWLQVTKTRASMFQEALRESRKAAAADRLLRALDNPEGVDPKELGRILRSFLDLHDKDAEAAGEALHRGY
jgi:hypothetical protein